MAAKLLNKKNKKTAKSSKSGQFHYDPAKAQHAVDFIEKFCTHVKGEWAGQPLILEEWQKKDIICPLFGWRRKDGTRRYRECWIEVARKNAKTTLAVAIQLYLFFCDGEPSAEIYFAAAAKLQANIAFDVATEMIKQNPTLKKNAEIWKNSIVLKDTSTCFKAISAEAYSKHGFNAHGILIDEIHAQPNSELIDVLTTSTGARRQPLTIYITTAGIMKKGHVAWELHKKAKDIKKGLIKDDHFLSIIYQAESTDDPFAESTWKKCNPNYGISCKESYMRENADRAKREPSFYNTFLRLHLNVWTTSEKTFIPGKTWKKCNLQKIDETFFYGKDCSLAFDLSSTGDFTALCIGTKDNGTYHVLPYVFIPKRKAEHRNMRDQIYAWEREGYVTLVDGISLDYEFVLKKINELQQNCNIQSIAYDRWNKSWLVNQLANDEAPLKEFGQGYKTMSPALKEFEKLIGEKKLNHGGHPVLEWMNGNMAVTEDAAGNIKPDKQKSTEKIDGMVAAIMCIAMLIDQPADTGKSIYEERGLLTL